VIFDRVINAVRQIGYRYRPGIEAAKNINSQVVRLERCSSAQIIVWLQKAPADAVLKNQGRMSTVLQGAVVCLEAKAGVYMEKNRTLSSFHPDQRVWKA
jgi:hypothetical protein